MVSYKKQYPGMNGIRPYGWKSAMESDMSEPGTFIRPDIPLGSGPARSLKTTNREQNENPEYSKYVKNLEKSKVLKPIKYTQHSIPCDPMHMRYSPKLMNCVFPIKCPPKSDESKKKPMKSPEKPQEWEPPKKKCPAKAKEYRCPKMPDSSVCRGNIDHFPIAMAYVPWQHWNQIYPIETAMVKGTLFAELDKPFMMGRCR